MNSDGETIRKVPKSCIGSAEYIMQCMALNNPLPYIYKQKDKQKEEKREPYVIARFGITVDKKRIRKNKPEDVRDVLKQLLSSENKIELTKLLDQRMTLAQLAKKEPEVVQDALLSLPDIDRNGVVINASTSKNLQMAGQDLLGMGIKLTDYDFPRKGNTYDVPEVGQGLICLDKTQKNEETRYNMHLGAVIARDCGNGAKISNMMEDFGVKAVMFEPLKAIDIDNANKFRSKAFPYTKGEYALGLLQVDPETDPRKASQFRGGADSSENEANEEDADSSEDEAEEEEEE